MDHNLEDSLNLESAIGVDFEPSEDVVVSQSDITLNASGHDGLPMEFQHIEEQPMLMDTGSEEIIDFMGEQFTLQEYSVQDDQMTGPTTTVEENENMLSQSDTLVDLQFDPQIISVPAAGLITDVQTQPKYITVKAAPSSMRPTLKKETATAPVPRQVAIAPKPPKLAQLQFGKVKAAQSKQYAIAPKPAGKPITFANRSVSLVKKVSLAGAVQANAKGNTVLAQIGKQLVMMPAGGSQKIKLVSTGSGIPTVRLIGNTDADQAQLIASPNVSGSQTSKQVVTKVIVQGQHNTDGSNQPAMITKLMPAGSTGANQPRFLTMQQKTIPISIGKQVLMASPTKQGVKFARKQEIITIKSPTTKILPGPAPQGITTKKVVISGNPGQNLILKTTAPPKGKVTVSDGTGQRTQLHQINVPGKGIQYIRLVTNPTSAVKTTRKVQAAPPGKTFVLADGKGNLIQMSADKMSTSQPPPLVVTNSTINKLTAKPQQKLVRIAPISSKTAQAAMMQQARSGQSLLAPLSPAPESESATLEDVNDVLDNRTRDEDEYERDEDSRKDGRVEEEIDSKAALHALIADAVGEDAQDEDSQSVHDGSRDTRHLEVEYDRRQSSEQDDSNSASQPERAERSNDHPLIVIPSFMKQDMDESNDNDDHEESQRMNHISVEVDAYNPYNSPESPTDAQDPDLVSTELGLRPRKACNCTKSQCLKLYCDCFANGEFCNRCNCNNCHNNLENEELRQKAIRGCLDRNPNAFRPKIGKGKSGGADLIRRHNKGCNCKRSGCLKNYCECYEAKIACTSICKCVGCRNVEETVERARRRDPPPHRARSPVSPAACKQPCSFMTTEVIEAVCQCLLAAAAEGEGDGEGSGSGGERPAPPDPVRDVLDEFTRCLQDIISASRHAAPRALLDETHA